MRTLIVLTCLLIGPGLSASGIVSFGERETYALGAGSSGSGPSDAGKKAFYEAFASDVARGVTLERTLDLVSPPAWGKTVGPDAGGRLQFHHEFGHGFVCRATLEHLDPDHAYILTLNGNPAKPGNALLSTPVPGNEQEKYYDFLIVRTNASGAFKADLGIYLKPGRYDVRWYVKDTADFKIVLYRDFFEFDVR